MSISESFSIAGKVAVITGGAAGIGLGIVEEFDKAGAKVLAIGRRPDGAASIAKIAPNAVYFATDIQDPASADAILAKVIAEFGTVDILVNNAALLENSPIEGYSLEYIDRMLNTNVRAVLLLIQAFVAACKSGGHGGKVVNIGSLEGYVATLPSGMGVYGATKTAMRGLTVSLARELGPFGIAVNCIAPGVIVHPNLFARNEEMGHSREQLEAAMEQLKERTNMGRMGEPRDIANACIFLASPASDYISGQTLLVDGGVTARGS